MRDRGLIGDEDEPAFQVLKGGVSNRTVWVGRGGRGDWVIKQALQKLRVQVDWFSDPERIQREAAGLRWLGGIIPGHVPEVVFNDSQRQYPGDDRCSAASLQLEDRRYSADTLMFDSLSHSASCWRRSTTRRYVTPNWLRNSPSGASLRSCAWNHITDIRQPKRPDAAPFLTQLIEETRARRFALVHGDYSPKNVLIHRDRLVILDYEVIHFGDPAFDIGFSLTHFLSKAHHLPARRDAFLDMARRYWRSYLRELAPHLRDMVRHFAVQHTLACMLARVAGRSPLEYLDDIERESQKRIVLELMKQDISAIPDLIDAVSAELSRARE